MHTPRPTSPTTMTLAVLFRFPNPVNGVAARVVAGTVAAGAWVTLGTRWPWLLPFIAYGFLARVLTGPTLSPLGQLATRVVAPRISPLGRPVAGPPKRFAQGIGALVSVAATLLWLVAGLQLAGLVLVAILGTAASLESVFAFCIGCRVFDILMRIGVVPPTVCEACSNLAARPGNLPKRLLDVSQWGHAEDVPPLRSGPDVAAPAVGAGLGARG